MSINRSDKPQICSEWKWFTVILVVIIVGLLSIIKPAGDRFSTMQKLQHASDLQLKSIGILILSFETNYHTVPQKLSQIVPSNRLDLLPTFYAPGRAESRRPSDWRTNELDIDLYSDYAFPTQTDTAILAFEKPGIWKDGTVSVCTTNLSVVRMGVTNFNNAIK